MELLEWCVGFPYSCHIFKLNYFCHLYKIKSFFDLSSFNPVGLCMSFYALSGTGKTQRKYQVLISVLPLLSRAVSATDVAIVVLIYELLGRVGWVALMAGYSTVKGVRGSHTDCAVVQLQHKLISLWYEMEVS